MDAGETRQRILAAAAAEFAEKGWSGATIRSIAARSGVNEVTLFRHFGTKQVLFASVMDQIPVSQALVERESAAIKELPPRQALYQIGIYQLRGLERHIPWL